MQTSTLQNDCNQSININYITNKKELKQIRITEKIGDLCFDIVKFLITASMISTIFLQITNVYLVLITSFIFSLIFIGSGIWLYKINQN